MESEGEGEVVAPAVWRWPLAVIVCLCACAFVAIPNYLGGLSTFALAGALALDVGKSFLPLASALSKKIAAPVLILLLAIAEVCLFTVSTLQIINVNVSMTDTVDAVASANVAELKQIDAQMSALLKAQAQYTQGKKNWTDAQTAIDLLNARKKQATLAAGSSTSSALAELHVPAWLLRVLQSELPCLVLAIIGGYLAHWDGVDRSPTPVVVRRSRSQLKVEPSTTVYDRENPPLRPLRRPSTDNQQQPTTSPTTPSTTSPTYSKDRLEDVEKLVRAVALDDGGAWSIPRIVTVAKLTPHHAREARIAAVSLGRLEFEKHHAGSRLRIVHDTARRALGSPRT